MQSYPEILKINEIFKASDDLYREVTRTLDLSDSAFDIFYSIFQLGNGCLQKDICNLCFANKQTINSSIHTLARKNYLYLQRGRGRDMHIYLTDAGKRLIEEKIYPVIHRENNAVKQMDPEDFQELIRLADLYIKTLKKQFEGENEL